MGHFFSKVSLFIDKKEAAAHLILDQDFATAPMVFMVAGEGIEPPTSRLWAWQATSALPRDKYCYLV